MYCLGMMGNLKKALRVLESKEKTFRQEAKAELDKARAEGEGGFAFNRRRMDQWLTGLVKIRVQEELVKAKTNQILTYSDELSVSQPVSLTEPSVVVFQSRSLRAEPATMSLPEL